MFRKFTDWLFNRKDIPVNEYSSIPMTTSGRHPRVAVGLPAPAVETKKQTTDNDHEGNITAISPEFLKVVEDTSERRASRVVPENALIEESLKKAEKDTKSSGVFGNPNIHRYTRPQTTKQSHNTYHGSVTQINQHRNDSDVNCMMNGAMLGYGMGAMLHSPASPLIIHDDDSIRRHSQTTIPETSHSFVTDHASDHASSSSSSDYGIDSSGSYDSGCDSSSFSGGD